MVTLTNMLENSPVRSCKRAEHLASIRERSRHARYNDKPRPAIDITRAMTERTVALGICGYLRKFATLSGVKCVPRLTHIAKKYVISKRLVNTENFIEPFVVRKCRSRYSYLFLPGNN